MWLCVLLVSLTKCVSFLITAFCKIAITQRITKDTMAYKDSILAILPVSGRIITRIIAFLFFLFLFCRQYTHFRYAIANFKTDKKNRAQTYKNLDGWNSNRDPPPPTQHPRVSIFVF